MKTATLVLVGFLAGGLAWASDQKSFFLVITKANDGSATRGTTSGIAQWLDFQVTKALKKQFPCVDYTTPDAIGAILEVQRQRALLGSNVDDVMGSVGGSMGLHDYVISLTVTPLGGRTVFHATCVSLKKAKTVSMDTDVSGAGADAALNSCEEFANRFVQKLAYLEPCPYKGPMHVTVQSKRNKEEKEEYPVYCNQSDQTYKKSTKLSKEANADWNLQKTGRRSASGTVQFQNQERTEIVEEDGCHPCPSGRQGGRTWTQTTTATDTVEGLSEESRREGNVQSDARITLAFSEDDTFTVTIDATSKDGTRHERFEEKAEGTCDTKHPPPKVVDRKINAPLKGRWGPFAGSPLDKVLQGKNTERKTDPVTKEETVTSIEFELHRD